MKISGFTIVRNAILNDYPVIEAITSVLPLVDEMIVSIDNGDDDSEGLIRSIGDPKIRIIHSKWDMNLRQGGKVYAVETDKAMQAVSPDSDWLFYIQADEVIHEKYYPAILEAAKKYVNNKKVEGLLFKYLHFYGTYDYVGDSRKWYNHEVRIIRNQKNISSYKDAQGFRIGEQKLKVVEIDAVVYHYGWVKSPKLMKQKHKNVLRFYTDDDEGVANFLKTEDFFDFNQFDSLKKFTGTHPKVMHKRIGAMNWNVELDVSAKHFKTKEKILFWIEKKTGKRLFDFKNYKRIKA